MAIEAWELVQRQKGNIEPADRLAGFRAKFGDAVLPHQTRSVYKSTVVEVEDRLNQILRRAPLSTREFIARIFHNYNQNHVSEGYDPEKARRMQALMVGYYGTEATVKDIAEAFSLSKPGDLIYELDDYLWDNPERIRQESITRQKLELPIRRLERPTPYHPIDATVEVIKDYADLWTYVQRRYIPEVNEIQEHIEGGKAVIISGPFGVGKTHNLLQPLEYFQEEKGKKVVSFDGQIFDPRSQEDIWQREWSDKGSKQGVLLVDEIPSLVRRDPEAVEQMLKRVKKEDLGLVLVNATGSPENRAKIIQVLTEMGESSGIEFVTHNVRQVQIPEELARKYLVMIGASEELINIFLNPENIALLHPRLFYVLQSNSKGELLRQLNMGSTGPGKVWQEYLSRAQGGSKADYVRMIKNLGINDEESLQFMEAATDY